MFPVQIDNQVAWVTGGSRGIGKASCIALAKAGCSIAVGYNSKEDEAIKVVEEIQALGKKAIAVGGNIADAQACAQMHEKIERDLGPVNILVNSAGMIRDNLFIMLEEDDWQSVLNTNIMGTVHTCKHVIRGMMGKRFGRIINLSSISATRGGRGQANYAASKGAVEAMTRSLAVELGSRNITVNCIAPGVIETDMSAEVIRLAKDEILERQIIKRFGNVDEIAAWVVFLASAHGNYITGQTIHIDGGLKMV
jgi:3-oxoacyl-[acyl-carrier protein] reductase